MKRSLFVPLAFLLGLAATGNVDAQDRNHPHDPARDTLGTVHFETSCSPSAQARFDRTMALLHSFEFGASIRGFTDVLAADSTCAMAAWGLAMSRWSNPVAPGIRPQAGMRAGRAAADLAMRLAANATERERGYINAVSQLYADYEHVDQQTRMIAYERAMAGLVTKQPADTEAKIFYALALTASALPTDKTYANQLKAGAILEGIWASQPNHPGLAHYIIHAYDYPALAGKATAAAERYSRIAPSAAHALHMPSHTFTRVGLWKESAETNRNSMDIARRDASIAEVLHAADYAEYAYLQMRRIAAAKAVLDQLPALEARFDVNAVTGAAPGSAGVYALAAIPARYALERHDWPRAARLVPKQSAFPWTEALVYFARAVGASRTGTVSTAQSSIDSLSAIQRRLQTMGETYWAEQVAIQQLGARAWLARAQRRNDAALALMNEAVAREDATEKSAVSPGPLAPAHEMLGDMFMELRRPTQALAEYRAALRNEPNRYNAVDGARRAALASGNRAAAARYAAQLKKVTGG